MLDPVDHIPGAGPRTLIRIEVSGWDSLLWMLLPVRVFARRIARKQLEIYGRNPLKETPLLLLRMPDGSLWRIVDASSETAVDLDVEPFDGHVEAG